MIAQAAVCPHPPVLLPGATGTGIDEVETLRMACQRAVAELAAAAPEIVIVIGAASGDGMLSSDDGPGSHRFAPGSSEAVPGRLPLSLAVGRALLGNPGEQAEWHAIDRATPKSRCRAYGHRLAARTERIGLLVLGDGSARRGPKAPASPDERAVNVDGTIEDGLRTGAVEPLLALDRDFADELLIAGRPAWQVLAGACERRAIRSTCHYSDDPFGVWYPVFSWTLG